MYQLTGTLKSKEDTVQVSEKFSKREFVITDNGSMYPQDILFQLEQDKCNLIDNAKPGDRLTVSFNLRGREWTSPQGEVRYFNTLSAWRIERDQSQPAQSTPAPSDDDLPF